MRVKLLKLAPFSKKPVEGEWKMSSDPEEHAAWIADGFNVGLLTGEPNGIMVTDVDEKDLARKMFCKFREQIRTIVETRRGAHFYFSGSQSGCKAPWGDLKGTGGYVVLPPSRVRSDGVLWEYRWVPGYEFADDLPTLPEELYGQCSDNVMTERRLTRGKVGDALKYVQHVQAISGKHGHNSTFRAACILRDSGTIDEATALAVMVEWNKTNANPPWETKDLLKKVRDAYRKVKA